MSQSVPAGRPTEAVAFTFEPKTNKLHGLPLVATWSALIVGSWAVVYGVVKLAF